MRALGRFGGGNRSAWGCGRKLKENQKKSFSECEKTGVYVKVQVEAQFFVFSFGILYIKIKIIKKIIMISFSFLLFFVVFGSFFFLL